MTGRALRAAVLCYFLFYLQTSFKGAFTMKKIFLLTALIFGVFLANFVEAASIKDHPRIAVMNFANKAITSKGLREYDFSSASEYAIYQLSASNWFDLIDYEQMATVARIHSMNLSGLVDTSTAPVLGNFLSAQYIMVGTLTGMTVKESGAKVGAMGGKAGIAKHTVTANVTVRFVDMETLQIVAVGMGTGTSSSTSAEISFTPYRNLENWIIPRQTNIIIGDGNTINNVTNQTISTADNADYFITIGTTEVSAVQVRNALSKAIRDSIYGKQDGILTRLNGGKQLKIKTGF